uniref:Uncharacterized protein n=1 Tax=Oryza glumipatula TaxID=40148 RepID=A0A0E0BS98_9ORYZ
MALLAGAAASNPLSYAFLAATLGSRGLEREREGGDQRDGQREISDGVPWLVVILFDNSYFLTAAALQAGGREVGRRAGGAEAASAGGGTCARRDAGGLGGSVPAVSSSAWAAAACTHQAAGSRPTLSARCLAPAPPTPQHSPPTTAGGTQPSVTSVGLPALLHFRPGRRLPNSPLSPFLLRHVPRAAPQHADSCSGATGELALMEDAIQEMESGGLTPKEGTTWTPAPRNKAASTSSLTGESFAASI